MVDNTFTATDALTDDQVLNVMYQQLDRLIGINAKDWETIATYLKVKTVPAKSTLQRIDADVRYHYFMVQGLVRLYYITPEGKDINKGFYSEGHIVGSLSGLISKEPSRFGVETLEPCTLIEVDLRRFDELMESCEGWARMFNHSCRMMLLRNERREAELLTMSSKARFLQFSRNFKDDIDRIPQYHIASYLGITPSALSRYKKKWVNNT